MRADIPPLWIEGRRQVKARDTSGLDSTARKIEMIASEEIALAQRTVVEHAHSIGNEELLTMVASSFGIQRVTSNIQTLLKRQLRILAANGVLLSENSLL